MVCVLLSTLFLVTFMRHFFFSRASYLLFIYLFMSYSRASRRPGRQAGTQEEEGWAAGGEHYYYRTGWNQTCQSYHINLLFFPQNKRSIQASTQYR